MYYLETRFLIVEDTEITRAIVRKMLEKMGYKKITESINGMNAYREIQQALDNKAPYEVIIADWNMPELNGLELLKKVQALPAMNNSAFIMLTSNIEKDQVVEAIKAGVNLYLAKPFPASALERKLKEAWDLTKKKKAS